jgi:hypothetical protein
MRDALLGALAALCWVACMAILAVAFAFSLVVLVLSGIAYIPGEINAAIWRGIRRREER